MHAGLGNFPRNLMWKILPSIRWILNRCLLMLKLVILSIRQKMRTDVFCAVGTTVMRAIETAVGTDGHLKEFEGWTNKFIFPPYDFFGGQQHGH